MSGATLDSTKQMRGVAAQLAGRWLAVCGIIVTAVAGGGSAVGESATACVPVISTSGILPNCSGMAPPPGASCAASTVSALTPAATGFTVTFGALLQQQRSSPYQMGLISQCDCVCNRPGAVRPAFLPLSDSHTLCPLHHPHPLSAVHAAPMATPHGGNLLFGALPRRVPIGAIISSATVSYRHLS